MPFIMRWTAGALSSLVFITAIPAASLRPFEVVDSIGMTRPFSASQESDDAEGSLSPDGRWSVVVLRRGLLQSALNEYSLVVFDTQEVRDFLDTPARTRLPQRHELVRFSTGSWTHGIEQERWLKRGTQLLFLGRGARTDEIGQLFVFDVPTRTLRQLTHSPHDIRLFNVTKDEGRVLYTAATPRDWRRRNRQGYVVQGEQLSNVMKINPAEASQQFTYHALDLRTGQEVSFALDNPDPGPRVILLSPSGQWGLLPLYVRQYPLYWREYRGFIKEAYLTETPPQGWQRGDWVQAEEDTFGGIATVSQIQLLDLAHGTARSLDIPTLRYLSPSHVVWSPEGARVALVQSYLPLSGSTGAERQRRRDFKAVVEVDLRSGEISRVTDLPRPPEGKLGDVTYLQWLHGGPAPQIQWLSSDVLLVKPNRSADPQHPPHTQCFRKAHGRWIEDIHAIGRNLAPMDAEPAPPMLIIQRAEEPNAPSELEAFDTQSGRKRLITDLNPALRTRALTRTELFEWTDRSGALQSDALTFPVNYRAGVRYPLVIQTYGGFGEMRFDRVITSGFAGRTFAGRGILVANTLCDVQDPGYGENGASMRCYEDFIDALDRKGLIDRSRIGLLGFSRSGMHVHYAVTFSKYPLAAALVSDSTQSTPWVYAMDYGSVGRGMREFDDTSGYLAAYNSVPLIGTPFFGDGVKRWLERSPAFNLHRIRTPLRFETHGVDYQTSWDTFAILKRQHRPVELLHLPTEGHNAETPLGRYASQQGSVDWFSFWLQGAEDSDPSKAAQYERWRLLRRQHMAHFAEASLGKD